MEDIKPIKKPNRNYLKISLPLAGIFVLIGGVFLSVNTAMQQQENRSRASYTIQPTTAPILPAPTGTVKKYIIEGDTWKYLDNNTRPTGWETKAFGDTAWKSGQAQFGYGDGDERTQVGYGSNSSSKYITTYFRKSFSVANPNVITNLSLRLKRDDGAVVYLNGTEVYRSGMPTGAVSQTTRAYEATDENAWYTAAVNRGLLISGTNVIAVEVHQVSPDSSDLSFDMSLSGVESVPTNTPVPSATTVPPTSTPVPTIVPATTLNVNKTSVTRGEMVTVTWANIRNATPRDWIGLYTPTAANGSEIGWIYVNCTQTATVAVPSGSCTFPVPDTAPNGSVELRLHPNDGNDVLAKSQLFTVTGGSSTSPTATTIPSTTTVPSLTTVPTEPVEEGNTYATVNLLLHGIGKGGDAVNAGGTGNMSPLRLQRTVTVDIYDVNNQLVLSKQGTVNFNPTLGNFSGNVALGDSFNTGMYTVKVKSEQYLRGLVSGIQTLTNGQTTSLANVVLVAGDVNNDNAINIVDYNIIVGCYSDLLPPISCNDINKVRADLNDDGKVNQFDYNLFIRELTNLGGQ